MRAPARSAATPTLYRQQREYYRAGACALCLPRMILIQHSPFTDVNLNVVDGESTEPLPYELQFFGGDAASAYATFGQKRPY